MNEIQEASKIIQDMQVKVLTTSPMWMRLNYLCNVVNQMLNKGHEDADIDWNKINEFLTTNVNEYDYNAFERIETPDQLAWVASQCKIASICDDMFIWQKHTCKDCGKQFFMRRGEVSFYERKELHVPKRCMDCRDKRKARKQHGKS